MSAAGSSRVHQGEANESWLRGERTFAAWTPTPALSGHLAQDLTTTMPQPQQIRDGKRHWCLLP